MKRFYLIYAFLLAFAVQFATAQEYILTSVAKKGATYLNVAEDSLLFDLNYGEMCVAVNSNTDFQVESDAPWCIVEKDSAFVNIFVEPNGEGIERSTFVTIKTKDGNVRIVEVKQLGIPPVEYVPVTFYVAVDNATRAMTDGTSATVLQYAVYDAEGNEIKDLTVKDGEISGVAAVDFELIKGNEYTVVFWAAAPEAPYSVDFETKKMTVNYENALCSDESRDAFYASRTFTVYDAQMMEVYLRRPFAMLNISTTDYEVSAAAGYAPTHSTITVKNVCNTFDLMTGEASGSVEAAFGYNKIPDDSFCYPYGSKCLSLNYLLVPDDKNLVDVEHTDTDGTIERKRWISNIPVLRNYCTSIYGRLITSDVDICVQIGQGW